MESTTSTGSGDIALAGALPAMRPFSVLSDGTRFPLVIEQGTQYEQCEAIYNAGSDTITRSFFKHSSSGSRLNLTGDGAIVYLAADDRFFQTVPIGRLGLTSYRHSATQLRVRAGSIHNHDATRRISFAAEQTLDLTNPSHFATGSARAAATHYYVLAAHLISDGSAVLLLSEDLEIPSGCLDVQLVAWCLTDGSQELAVWRQDGDLFKPVSENFVLSDTTPDADPTEITVRMTCPLLAVVENKCQFRLNDPAANQFVGAMITSGGSLITAPFIATDNSLSFEFGMPVDAIGNNYFLVIGSVSPSFQRFQIASKGFRLDIGQAGLYL